MDNKVNYLDIQLRDMDYRNFYSNLYDKFIDPLGFYMGEDKKHLFEQGFSKALKEAKSNLLFQSYNAQSIKNQIVVQKNGKMSFRGTEIYQMMNGQYKERLKKEQTFIENWTNVIVDRIDKKYDPQNKQEKKIVGSLKSEAKKLYNNFRITELANAESLNYWNRKNQKDPYMENYVNEFDKLVKKMNTIEDIGNDREQKKREIIFQKIRSNQFAIEMAGGLSSAVYSTNAVSKYLKQSKSTQNIQQGLQGFYEDLFNVFFFNVSGGTVKGSIKGKTPTEMWTLLTAGGGIGTAAAHKNALIAKQNFETKFKDFVNKYYKDIIKNEELDNFFKKINTDYIEKIFAYQTGVKTGQRFTFGEKTGGKFKYERGVSSTTQAQLKKMLEETFKGVANENNMSSNHYHDFNERMKGLVRIDDHFVSNLNGDGKILCYKDLQIEIDEAQAKRKLRLELQKILKSKSISLMEKQQKLDEAYNNGQGYISKDEYTQKMVDMRHSNVAFEKEIRSKFINLFISKLQSCFPDNHTVIWRSEENKNDMLTNRNIRDKIVEDEKIIRDATFKRIEGNAKTGKLFLQAMSAYSPEAVKGLLGEISAAYELRTRGITDIQVVGSEEDSLKMQKHYDVVFSFKGNRFGMQVKNVKTSDDVVGRGVKYTLYRTELSLAEKAMYRYFSPDQVKTYRWLFANGTFLEKNGVDTVNDIKELLTVNFLAATPEFLRIRNASELNTGKSIDSDIYLIGNTFYPSSYFIYKAYKIAVQQFFENAKKGKLFKISGDFPAYVYKADPYLEISKGKYIGGLTDKDGNLTTKERSYRLNSKGKMEETKRNLVVIDDPKTRLLYGKKIIFSGITLQL